MYVSNGIAHGRANQETKEWQEHDEAKENEEIQGIQEFPQRRKRQGNGIKYPW